MPAPPTEVVVWLLLGSKCLSKIYIGPYPYSLAPGSDWDLRLLREHRETLALDGGFPARLVFLPFIIYLL